MAGFQLDHVVVSRNDGLDAGDVPVLVDVTGDLFDRYDAQPGAGYVLRPDAHIAGRTREISPEAAERIVARSLAQARALRACR